MNKQLLAIFMTAILGACQNPAAPDSGVKPNLTSVTVVSVNPGVGSRVNRGDQVAVTVDVSYNVTALLTQNVQPRLFAHRAGDPATMLVGGMMFPRGNSYMELPPRGSVTLTFDGDLGGRAFYDAESGSTIDYAVLMFMYKTATGNLDFVSYQDGKSSVDSQPIPLNWNVQ